MPYDICDKENVHTNIMRPNGNINAMKQSLKVSFLSCSLLLSLTKSCLLLLDLA